MFLWTAIGVFWSHPVEKIQAVTDFAYEDQQFVFEKLHGDFASPITERWDDQQETNPLEAKQQCFPENIVPDGYRQEQQQKTKRQEPAVS